MSLRIPASHVYGVRFPRVSGDEPAGVSTTDILNGFSPRERG